MSQPSTLADLINMWVYPATALKLAKTVQESWMREYFHVVPNPD
jgi:hypothetical protein